MYGYKFPFSYLGKTHEDFASRIANLLSIKNRQSDLATLQDVDAERQQFSCILCWIFHSDYRGGKSTQR